MKISRELALKILKYLLDNEKFEFPFNILCKSIDGSDNFVEVIPKYDYEILIKTEKYNDFKLCGNLQNLDLETLRLMSQGFIEKIEKVGKKNYGKVKIVKSLGSMNL